METIQQQIDNNMILSVEKSLREIYAKRLRFLECKWSALMEEQNTMSMDEILSDEFQAKRKRIGGLYNEVRKIIETPEKKKIETFLGSIKRDFHKLPSESKITFTL